MTSFPDSSFCCLFSAESWRRKHSLPHLCPRRSCMLYEGCADGAVVVWCGCGVDVFLPFPTANLRIKRENRPVCGENSEKNTFFCWLSGHLGSVYDGISFSRSLGGKQIIRWTERYGSVWPMALSWFFFSICDMSLKMKQ